MGKESNFNMFSSAGLAASLLVSGVGEVLDRIPATLTDNHRGLPVDVTGHGGEENPDWDSQNGGDEKPNGARKNKKGPGNDDPGNGGGDNPSNPPSTEPSKRISSSMGITGKPEAGAVQFIPLVYKGEKNPGDAIFRDIKGVLFK